MHQMEYHTVTAAARLLAESRWTTLRRIKRNEITAIKTGDNTSAWLIPAAEVARIIDERRAA